MSTGYRFKICPTCASTSTRKCSSCKEEIEKPYPGLKCQPCTDRANVCVSKSRAQKRAKVESQQGQVSQESRPCSTASVKAATVCNSQLSPPAAAARAPQNSQDHLELHVQPCGSSEQMEHRLSIGHVLYRFNAIVMQCQADSAGSESSMLQHICKALNLLEEQQQTSSKVPLHPVGLMQPCPIVHFDQGIRIQNGTGVADRKESAAICTVTADASVSLPNEHNDLDDNSATQVSNARAHISPVPAISSVQRPKRKYDQMSADATSDSEEEADEQQHAPQSQESDESDASQDEDSDNESDDLGNSICQDAYFGGGRDRGLVSDTNQEFSTKPHCDSALENPIWIASPTTKQVPCDPENKDECFRYKHESWDSERICVGCGRYFPTSRNVGKVHDHGHRKFFCCGQENCRKVASIKALYLSSETAMISSRDQFRSEYAKTVPYSVYQGHGGDTPRHAPCILCHRQVDFKVGLGQHLGFFFDGRYCEFDLVCCPTEDCCRFASNLCMHRYLTNKFLVLQLNSIHVTPLACRFLAIYENSEVLAAWKQWLLSDQEAPIWIDSAQRPLFEQHSFAQSRKRCWQPLPQQSDSALPISDVSEEERPFSMNLF